MSTHKLFLGAVVAIVLVAVSSDLVFAQNAPPPGGAQQQRGRFDPAAMNQRLLDRMKEMLQIGDEDWKVIQPVIEKVQTLSREVDSGAARMGFVQRGGRGGPNRPADATTELSGVAKALQEVQKVLENEAATPEEIRAKLKALREAREKAKQDLAKARESLRELLSLRQEAQLVLMGLLD